MKQASTISKSTSSKSNSPFQQQNGNGSLVSENNPPFFSSPVVQNKLTVGAPDDVYEKEADAMADKLVQRLKEPMADAPASQNGSPAIQTKCAACEQEEQVQQKEEITEEGKEKLQTKAIFESNEEPVQTKALSAGIIQSKCASCEEEEKVQTKPNENTAIDASPAVATVQAKLSIGQAGDPYEREADAVADKVVQRSMAEGTAVQAKVEPVIGSITPLLQSKAAINEKLQEKQEDNEKEITDELQKKPIADTANRGETIQRYCRECEEGLIFRKATGMVQLAEDAPGDGSRESIVAAAKAELGKVEAKRDDGTGKRIGADRLLEYFHIAAPGVWQDSDIENSGGAIPAWCGIFSVYAHKKAGKDIGTWQMGTGVTAFNTLESTDNPQPGDIGYIHEPYRHHCIIKEINGDTVISIDGNSGAFSEVIENTRSFSDYDAFFTAFGGGGSSVSVQRKEEKDEPLQTKPAAAACSASAGLEQQLSASKGAGSSMPDDVRGNMEQNFGADFGNVRIHTDTSAVQMSKDLHAQAFTHGSDIYFNSGKYDPQSSSGKHLLAHELTHTIQQGHVHASGTVQKQGTTTGTPPTTAKYIVEDAATPTANQLRKTDFLTRLNQDICRITDEVLIGTPFTSQTCPYISRGFQRLREKTPLEIETLLSRYERQLLTAETLQQYFEIIGNRVRTATTNWLQNGDLSGIPEEIAAQIPEHMRSLAGIAGRVSGIIGTVSSGISNLASGAEDVLSRIGRFLFKSKNGNARATQSPVSVMQNLGKGTTMESSSRGKMESAFGASFSNVAVHTDGNAAKMASDMNARAFTLGNHIAFGSGEYRPGTLTGDALMAHELAHVQQQKGSSATTMTKGSVTDNQPLETEADDTAVNVVTQLWGKSKGVGTDLSKKASPKLKTGLQLQRCSTPAGPEWDGNVSALRIDLFATNGISEQPVDPGEAITRDFPSFVARLNYWGHRFPRVMVYHVYNAAGELQFDRVPAERGVSRIPMLPLGAYRIVGDVATGQSGNGVVQVERNIRIIEPLKDVAATQAPGDLGRQAGHTLQGDLIGFEQFATVLRQNAVAVAGVSQELVDAWNAAHAQAVVIEGSINRAIDAGVHESGKTAIINFYRQLRSIVGGSDVYHPERTETEHDGLARSTSTFPAYTTNPYITQERTDENIRRLNAGGSAATDWRDYLNTFYQVTTLLNTYIADRLQAAGFTESATQLRNSGAYSTHLRQLYRDHPDAKPVRAVFYPKLQANLRNDAAEGEAPHYTLTGLPQKMYSYRAGDGVWHLLDVTRPSRPFDSFASGGSATVPPRELITGLDNPERFPEGVMHWQFEGGTADSCEMTHPWTPSDVLNFISAILALAGIAALVVASGGVAVPALVPTVLFIASGVVGAAAAREHMRESTELGTLTEQTVVMDSMAIAVNLLTAAAAGAGHIVRAARAAEVAYTGWRAGAALAAQTVLRPLQIATIGGDIATIITFTAQAAQQYTQIENMPLGEARTFALQRLVAMSLLTGGMTLMSLKGGLHDLGAGRTLYLDYTTIGDARRWVAHRVMPEGDLLAHTRLTGVRTEAEAVLARTDLDAGTLDQFRGELSVTLGTPGIAREEIEEFVRRMRTAGTPDEARRILVNFRESRVGVTVGGVSRNAGYDLTYFHTSPVDFHTSVRGAFEGEGHIVHNGRLTHVEGGDVSSYRLSVDTPSGVRVEADVEIVYQNFAEGSAVGTGTVTPGSGSGPARNAIRWDAEAGKWRVRVEVDQRLAPRDIRRAVGHELDEAGDVINRLHGTTGDVNAQIRQLVAPNLFGTGPLTSHDIATLRELDHLLAQRATNPAAGDALSIMMRDLGLTGGERTSFQDRLNRVISSGHIAPDRIGLMEALATWDNAQARGSRIGFTRDEFLERYQDGWRFDESGNFRWYKLDIDRTAVRQFFTPAEIADHNLAFDRLAGPGSTSSFKQYYDMLTEVLGNEATARTRVRSRLDTLMAHSRGGDLDFVRHELKVAFRRDVLDYVGNRGRLATAHPGVEFREASHMEMMRLTQGLNSSDKGNLAEAWYQEVFAPGAYAHVSVVGVSGTKRYPDLVNPDGVLQDLKYIEGALAARELEQFDDYRRMIGTSINVAPAGSPANNVTIVRLRYSFINPRGVAANADWMARTLASSTGNIHFEIFNNRGQRRIVSSAGVFETVGDRSTRVAGLEFLSDPAALGAWLNL